ARGKGQGARRSGVFVAGGRGAVAGGIGNRDRPVTAVASDRDGGGGGGLPRGGRGGAGLHTARRGGQFYQNDVRVASVSLFPGRDRGEVSRGASARHVNRAGAVQGDGQTLVIAVAAQVRREDERRAAGIQLGHESVVAVASRGRWQGIGGRKVRRKGLPRHISVAGGGHGDAEAFIIAVAAQGRGVDKCRTAGIYLGREGRRLDPHSPTVSPA